MQAFAIKSSRSPHYQRPCMQCGKLTKVGEAVLTQRHPTAKAMVEMVWHRRCIEQVLYTAPCDLDDEVVAKFRESLLNSGRYVESR